MMAGEAGADGPPHSSREDAPMPIKEEDPWRMQYFQGVACPEQVVIPTEDGDAYIMYPRQRWLYNKMLVAETQGIEHAPHGFAPSHYPVFSKPIYNMRGMGAGTRVLHNEKEYLHSQEPGHFWMELLTGEHVSTDCAVVDGEPRWWRHATGREIGEGMFDYWTVHAEPRPALEAYCGDWIRGHMAGYTGMLNLETIGGRIIEVHMRFADQWPDLYGPGWVEALVRLYAEGRWDYPDTGRRDGYSVVLFGGHGLRYRHPPPDLVAEVRALPQITSVQITFHADRPPRAHAMPPGGFRLCIVNCWDLDAGIAARQRLALSFWSTQTLYGRRRRSAGNDAARGA
jgi:hypothetical protein